MFQATYWSPSTATTSAVVTGDAGGALGFETLVAASTSGANAATPAHDYVGGGSASDLLAATATATVAVPLYTEMRTRGASGSGIASSQSAGTATAPQHTRHSSSYTRLSSSSSTPPLSLSSPQQPTASGPAGAGSQSGGTGGLPVQLSTGASAMLAMQPAFSSFAPSEWRTPASDSVADTAAAVAHYPHLPYEVMYVPSGSMGQPGGQNPLASASAAEATGLGQTAWLQSAASGLQYLQNADAESAFAVGLGVGGGMDSLAQWSSMPVAVAKTPFALPPEQFAAIGRMAPLAPHEMAAVAEQMCTCRPLLPYNPFSASRLVSPRSNYPPGLETAASATTFGASSSTNLSLLEQQSNVFGSGFGMGMGMGLGMASAPSSSSTSLRHSNELESPGAPPAHVHPAIASSAGVGVGASASAASLARSSSEERRVRNNEASKRSRRNQKAKQEQLQRTMQHLEADNLTLQNRLSRAQGLVRALREQVVQHMYTQQQ